MRANRVRPFGGAMLLVLAGAGAATAQSPSSCPRADICTPTTRTWICGPAPDDHLPIQVRTPLVQGETFGSNRSQCNVSVYRGSMGGTVLREWGPSSAFDVPQCMRPGTYTFYLEGRSLAPGDPGLRYGARASNSFTVQAGPYTCVFSASVDFSTVFQGDVQRVRWQSQNQGSFRLFLHTAEGTPINTTPYFPNGAADGRIVIVNPSSAQLRDFTVPATLPAASYKVKVVVSGSGGSQELFTPAFTVRDRPTVQGVTVSPASLYPGDVLNVAWTSTSQQRYEIYRCDPGGFNCTGPLASGNPSGNQGAAWTVPTDHGPGTYVIKVRVWSSSNASAEAISATFAILQRPTITVRFSTADRFAAEGGGPIVPTVTVTTSNDQPTMGAASVRFVFEPDTPAAGNGTDYQPTGDSLSIPQGTDSGAVLPIPMISILQDALDEYDERFRVILANPTPASVVFAAPTTHVVTIIDDDPTPTLSVASGCGSSVPEGHAGQTPCNLTISLSAPSGRPVSVSYGHAGTATAGQDYAGVVSGTASFPEGSTAVTVPRAIVGDTLDEFDETLVATLSAPVNATVANGVAAVTIIDDDPEPSVSVSDCPVTEGTGQQVNCPFTISLSAASGKTVAVSWATADGTAINGADYYGGAGTATFPPGVVSVAVPVGVIGDTLDEFVETAFLRLSAPTNATLGDAEGVLTITDDDEPPTMSISDCAGDEGSGEQAVCDFEVALSAASGKVVSVHYATDGGSGTYPATPAVDFGPVSGDLTFAPGATTRPVAVASVGDVLDEFDETYGVGLSAPVNAAIADGEAVGTILDDDPMPLVSLSDCSAPEGNVGYVGCTVTATLSAPSGRPISLELATADDAGNPATATAVLDYAPRVRSLSFAPGATAQSAGFPVRGDRLFEATEVFQVNAQNLVHVDLGDGQAHVIIENDDAPGFSMEDLGVVEGGMARFRVTPSPKLPSPAFVTYGTADGTATAADGDFTPTFGTLAFGPETASSLVVDVPVAAQDGLEGPETFRMVLSNPEGAPMGHAEATASIVEPEAGRSFDANLTTDLLWRHAGTGDLVVWFMDDLVLSAGQPTVPPGVADLAWKVVGTGDVNQDGHTDLVWSHATSPELAFWRMNGVALIDGALLPAPMDMAWRVVATGDFDRDGMTDLLWRHGGSNQLSIWHLDGVSLRDGILVVPPPPGVWPDVAWEVAGTGDFNRDGKTDVLWRHSLAGQLAVWYLDGHRGTHGELLDPSSVPSLEWELRSTRDLDRDGWPDLLWRHSLSGELVAWLMHGIVLRQGRYLSPASLPDTRWDLVGPR